MTIHEPRPWGSPAKAASSPAHASKVMGLIDELASVRQRIGELKKREEALQEFVKTLGPGEHKGARAVATVTESERKSLNTSAIKAAMPDVWIDLYTRQTTVTTVNIKPLV